VLVLGVATIVVERLLILCALTVSQFCSKFYPGKLIADVSFSVGGGVPTMSGQQLAEWVMNNRATLNLKYVIWGQKIWNPSDAVGGWLGWRNMEDRGDVTQNHW
jgi:hypothetical protein